MGKRRAGSLSKRQAGSLSKRRAGSLSKRRAGSLSKRHQSPQSGISLPRAASSEKSDFVDENQCFRAKIPRFARIWPRLCMQIRLGELFLTHQVSSKKVVTEYVS